MVNTGGYDLEIGHFQKWMAWWLAVVNTGGYDLEIGHFQKWLAWWLPGG